MTDLEQWKQLWQAQASTPESIPINKEELMAMLQVRTDDIRRRIVRRLRKEILFYGVILLIPVVNLLLRYGFTARAIVGIASVAAVLGLILAVLSYKEYRLRTLSLAGSVRESLAALIALSDSMMNSYMAAYMISIVVPVAALETYLLWRFGLSLLPMVALPAGAAFVIWCYQSGKVYVEQNFGRYRKELVDGLRELESA